MIEILMSIFKDHTLRTVILGSAILGITSGILGSFAILRKQSLLGDAISHSALPGIAIAFLLTKSSSPLVLLTGALVAGWISSICMMSIVRFTKIKYDGALAIVLSVFFGFGMMMLSIVQKIPDSRQAGLNKFLFGQAATLLKEDIITMSILGGTALFIVFLLWKEFKLLIFNPDFGESVGFPMKKMDILLTCLMVVSIVVGLQTVGVVLMSAMLIAPAAASRQWTNRLEVMAVLGGFFGAISGITGAFISSRTSNMPTGPIIVLVSFSLFILSFLFAPKRGILSKLFCTYKNNLKITQNITLTYLYHLCSKRKSVDLEELMKKSPCASSKKLTNILKQMKNMNLLQEHHNGWKLTLKGIEKAKELQMGGKLYE
ncbi:metal ABC transporter permease [Herbivorax sp. ANBcel31]|uniref:metal ABC transporter permease n=1 Tax=Herbivorax sp. ANBcel31 TaxID=3069754 RepID=UPI0027B683CB|nr:metal ABC transporter permease [Herbivorax sp. ANBcel31]MDQ2086575.1 metal ABC transporter permease [Herbivorax sp. ANBcel31]